jgi:hypothetical protein
MNLQELKGYLLERIDVMLEKPGLWGDREAVEFQTLLALELYAAIECDTEDGQELQKLVHDPYRNYLRNELDGGRENAYIFFSKDQMKDEYFTKHLGNAKEAVLNEIRTVSDDSGVETVEASEGYTEYLEEVNADYSPLEERPDLGSQRGAA